MESVHLEDLEQDEGEQLGEMAHHRLQRKQNLRRVSFPESDTDLVTGYLEPVNPLHLAVNVTNNQIIEEYVKSCDHHGTEPISQILEQIKKFDLCKRRSHVLDLKNYTITVQDCEPLEEIFKRMQFLGINLENCQLVDNTAIPLFDMLEYYDSTWQLNIAHNHDIGVCGWNTCARYLKRSSVQVFDCHNATFVGLHAKLFFQSFYRNKNLKVLNFESCNLNNEFLCMLTNSVLDNGTVRELYLGGNNLSVDDCQVLCGMFEHSGMLELLDLSNNNIQDAGFTKITTALTSSDCETMLKVLVVWNNNLSSGITIPLYRLIKDCVTIQVLNLGKNNLGDQTIVDLMTNYPTNRELSCLGLQSTGITCATAVILSQHFTTHHLIERIDLRGNNISLQGVMALCQAVHCNKRILQIDLDNGCWTEQEKDECNIQVETINKICRENRMLNENKVKDEIVIKTSPARKMSLTCPTIIPNNYKSHMKLRSPVPSPIVSPVSSSISMLTKSRFSVSRVSESCTPVRPSSSSRFTVTVVEPAKVTVGFQPRVTSLEKLLSLFQEKLPVEACAATSQAIDLRALENEGVSQTTVSADYANNNSWQLNDSVKGKESMPLAPPTPPPTPPPLGSPASATADVN